MPCYFGQMLIRIQVNFIEVLFQPKVTEKAIKYKCNYKSRIFVLGALFIAKCCDFKFQAFSTFNLSCFTAANLPTSTAWLRSLPGPNMPRNSSKRNVWKRRVAASRARTSRRRFTSWRRWSTSMSSISIRSTKTDSTLSSYWNCELKTQWLLLI